MQFQPAFCPCGSPQCKESPGFQYQRRGTFKRACDGRVVQRFQCKGCKRTFSTQTFRGDYRLRKPWLDLPIFQRIVSKDTQRQSARILHCQRATVARRLESFGKSCEVFHRRMLAQRDRSKTWSGPFVLDELETYEHDRHLKPLTVPVLVHKESYCILHAAVGTLPARKPVPPRKQKRLEELEADGNVRTSESREKVDECFGVLEEIVPTEGALVVRTDEKSSYQTLLKERFGERVEHRTTHSTLPRTTMNPLFAINHTFAMMRDGLSRLVRRTWAASKEREKLVWHLWTYIAWRNYVRPITNKRPHESAAMVAGLAPGPLQISDLLQCRILDPRAAQ